MGKHFLEDVGGVQMRRLEFPGSYHLIRSRSWHSVMFGCCLCCLVAMFSILVFRVCCLLLPLRSLDIAWRCGAKSKPIYQHRFVDGVSSFTSSLCVKCPKKTGTLRTASRSMGGGLGIHRCCL